MDGLFSVVFPTDCLLCGEEVKQAGGLSICQDCWASLERWEGPACARCGLPFASAFAMDAEISLCSPCQRDEPSFDWARSYGIYSGNLRKAILQLKVRERVGKRLGKLLAELWPASEDLEGRLLVPVPLHPARKRERGFNQAELLVVGLTDQLARIGQVPAPQLARGCLRRVRPTLPQAALSIASRRENVRGVFAVVRPEVVRERTIILVDDVMTTGVTLSACSAALKKAGAARVLALTLARATPQFPNLNT
jgi:ComF family protein